MNLHIDKAGRLVLPKSVRSQLGITPQTALELVQSADGILLRRVAERPSVQPIVPHRAASERPARGTTIRARNRGADDAKPATGSMPARHLPTRAAREPQTDRRTTDQCKSDQELRTHLRTNPGAIARMPLGHLNPGLAMWKRRR